MIRFRLIPALVIFAVLLPGPTRSAIRVNGNQLLEGGGEFRDASARRAGSKGGAATVPSRLVYTFGMGLMARGTLPDSILQQGGNTSNAIGIGLSFDIAHVVYDAFCPIALTGDVNLDGKINSADLIVLINYIFRSIDPNWSCPASGDVNCSGNVTSSDCTYLTNFIFKSGPEPCDVCSIIPTVWNCP